METALVEICIMEKKKKSMWLNGTSVMEFLFDRKVI